LGLLFSLKDGLDISQQELEKLIKEYINPGLVELMELQGLNSKFIRSDGTIVWDDEGHEYLDFTAGFRAMNLGHNPRVIFEAIERVKSLPALVHNVP